MKQLPISVVIPAFNEAKTIGLCLESLRRQTDLPEEILVIDDGSSDGTVETVRLLAQNYHRIKLLTQNHMGPALARNLGVKQAKGKILVFVDADMEFAPDFLVNLTRPIFSGQAKGTWSGEEKVKNWDNVWARCWNYNANRRQPVMNGAGRGQKRVFRAILKTEFDRVGGFDSIGYTDDWTLVNKLEYQPKPTRAKFYHHNPDTLGKVYSQAFWIGKRQYKLAKLGTVITLVKNNLIFSLIVGLIKSVVYAEPGFIVFKLIYDWGITRGAWVNLIRGSQY